MPVVVTTPQSTVATESVDWANITNKPACFLACAHAPTHISTGTDPIPVVATTATGLVPVLPPAPGTDFFLRGDATWANIALIQNQVVTTAGPGLVTALPNNPAMYFNGASPAGYKQVAFSEVTGTVDWNTQISNKPGTFQPSAHAPTHDRRVATDLVLPDWGDIQSKPATFPSDWNTTANKPATFPPSLHAPSHVTGGADIIPSANTTRVGLLNQLTGNATDFVGGDNACHTLGPVIVGVPQGTPTTSYAPGAIVVPRFADYPDGVWSPMGAFDDHFEGTTLNAKWAQNPGSSPVTSLDPSGKIYALASRICLNGTAAANNDTQYWTPSVTQSLPNANPTTISLDVDTLGYSNIINTGSAPGVSSTGGFFVQLRNTANSAATRLLVYITRSQNQFQTGPAHQLAFGIGAGTTQPGYLFGVWPRYFSVRFDASFTVFFSISLTGRHWTSLNSITAAQSGFSSSNPPNVFDMGCFCSNFGGSENTIDWVRLTNP